MPLRLVFIVIIAFMVGAMSALLLLREAGDPGAPSQQVSGKALIGGPFSLTDHTGKPVTQDDFKGKLMLVFFGYTYCPDICPAELQVMSAALDALGADAEKVTPVFITVDPARDTVEQMASYVASFHPRLVGLTGSEEAVKQAAKAYRVYYAKAGDANSPDYLVDHSAFVYLMGRDGNYLTHFSYGTSAEKMAAGIRKHL